MTDTGDIILVIGVGYFVLKQIQKTKKQVQTWTQEELILPFERLKAGTSIHYSPYSQRYFKQTSFWKKEPDPTSPVAILKRLIYG